MSKDMTEFHVPSWELCIFFRENSTQIFMVNVNEGSMSAFTSSSSSHLQYTIFLDKLRKEVRKRVMHCDSVCSSLHHQHHHISFLHPPGGSKIECHPPSHRHTERQRGAALNKFFRNMQTVTRLMHHPRKSCLIKMRKY